jgi:hypothetical protein
MLIPPPLSVKRKIKPPDFFLELSCLLLAKPIPGPWSGQLTYWDIRIIAKELSRLRS